MARKDTKVEQMLTVIIEKHEDGETYREIGTALGLSREEVSGAVKRWRRKARKIEAGYVPLAKGRSRKEEASEETKRNKEFVQLKMTVELLRNSLSEAGRK